jgi:probable phosphomutase (TIGR03848 family)
VTAVLLIRHGAHALQGKVLVGRTPGVHLSGEGRRQAETLAHRLAETSVRAIYSSPLERAQETAAPLAERLGLETKVVEDLNEIDFGDWTNQPIETLADDQRWHLFNSFRSGTTPPNGEAMLDVQARFVGMVEGLRTLYPGAQVAIVSHGDVIKSGLAHWLGVHLDLFQRIEVSPGSLSVVEIEDYGPRILRLNSLC